MERDYTLLTSPGFTINMSHYVLRAQDVRDGFIVNGNSHLRIYVDSDANLGYVFGAYLSVGIANLSNHRGQVIFRTSERVASRELRLKTSFKDAFNLETSFRDLENGRVEAIVYCKPLAKMLSEFGSGVNMTLPKGYLVSNDDYLMGILDGLEDFKGYEQDTRPVLKRRQFSVGVYNLYKFLRRRYEKDV